MTTKILPLLLPWVLVADISPAALQGQVDSGEAVHATLRGWEDNARLTIFDRSGSFHGRLSDRGILQRFTELLDHEYTLDLVSFGFSLTEDYRWYTNRHGARAWGGSINHRFLAQSAEFAGTVPVGEAWAFDVLFNFEETLQADRALVRAGFRGSFAEDKVTGFVTGYLKADKPEMDFELGLTLKPGRSNITVAFAALDLFNDLIYQQLGVGPPIAPQSLDYTKHPLTARVAADIPLGRFFRTEVYGLYMTPSQLVVTEQPAEDSSFVQDERYAYAGALLEWAPARHTALGAIATYVDAGSDRSFLDPSASPNAFDLTERTARVGAYGIRTLGRFEIEGRFAHEWRIENRLRADTTASPSTEYEDRAWVGRTSISYRARSGFRADVGFDFVLRDVVKAADLPGDDLDAEDIRLRFDLGWNFGETAMFVAGWKADLDGQQETALGVLDGAHGRFQVFWE